MHNKPFISYPLKYRNRQLRFAIDFPSWWRNYIVADRQAYPFQPNEHSLTFHFRYKGKTYGPLFTIIISTLTGKAWERYYGPSPVEYLAERDGSTYGYILPGELPEPFVYDRTRYRIPIRIMTKIVGEAPSVLKSTFHFIPTSGLSHTRCCLSKSLRRAIQERMNRDIPARLRKAIRSRWRKKRGRRIRPATLNLPA